VQPIKPHYQVVVQDERLVSHARVGLLAELADRVAGDRAPRPSRRGGLGQAAHRSRQRTSAGVAAGAAPPGRWILDLDATLIEAHSDAKQGAAPHYQGGFGFHPLGCWLDRGDGRGEPLAVILAPATPAPTTPPITSRCSRWPWRSSRLLRAAVGCWSAATAPAAATSCCGTCTSTTCASRSDGRSTPTPRTPCLACPHRPGSRRSTPTAACAMAPGWPRPPATWTWPAGRRAPARSAAKNAPMILVISRAWRSERRPLP
jgi:hypothetical protein